MRFQMSSRFRGKDYSKNSSVLAWQGRRQNGISVRYEGFPVFKLWRRNEQKAPTTGGFRSRNQKRGNLYGELEKYIYI
jgi:hypothetical protein